MRRPILRFGDQAVHTPARHVDSFGPDLHALVDDMIETMHAAPGIGLAAPQIGVPLRLFVVDVSVNRRADALVVMVNPAVTECEGLQLEDEGCLSVPGINAAVPRPGRIVVRGRDRDGVLKAVEATGLLARAFQHEIDHLDGHLFIERLRPLHRRSIERKIARLRARHAW